MRLPALGLFLAWLAACLPAPHVLEGRACNESHPCPEALMCVAGTCRAEGPRACDANRVGNGGFEGGTLGWRAKTAETAIEAQGAVVHSGNAALRVFAWQPDAGSGSYLNVEYDPDFTGLRVGDRWCFELWAQAGNTTERIWLTVRLADAQGQYTDVRWETVPESAYVPSDLAWHRLRSRVVVPADRSATLGLRVSTYVAAGREYFLDDARAWVDPAGTCELPPEAFPCTDGGG